MRVFEAGIGAYVLLISFSTLNAIDFSKKAHDTALSSSGYDGIAIPYVNAYHHEYVPHIEINEALDNISSTTNKKVWPWVFLNRIVGYDKTAKKSGAALKKRIPFSEIKGMDLKNETGSLTQFFNIIDGALKYAKENNTGLVLDLEPYNDHSLYHLPLLATKSGTSTTLAKEKLEIIGSEIIKKAHHLKKDMKIWLLFSGLDQKKLFKQNRKREIRSVTYIVEGMLKEAERLDSDIQIISGGELSIRYCHRNIQHLKDKILKRKNKTKNKGSHLKLAAPIVPYYSKHNVKGWLKNNGNCKKSQLINGSVFSDVSKLLMDEYKYIWVYSTGHSDYNPFKEKNSAMNNIIFQKKNY